MKKDLQLNNLLYEILKWRYVDDDILTGTFRTFFSFKFKLKIANFKS